MCDIDSTWTENVSGCGGLDEKCPYRPIYCSMVLSPVGGAVWGGHATFRRQSLAGGSISLGVGFENL